MALLFRFCMNQYEEQLFQERKRGRQANGLITKVSVFHYSYSKLCMFPRHGSFQVICHFEETMKDIIVLIISYWKCYILFLLLQFLLMLTFCNVTMKLIFYLLIKIYCYFLFLFFQRFGKVMVRISLIRFPALILSQKMFVSNFENGCLSWNPKAIFHTKTSFVFTSKFNSSKHRNKTLVAHQNAAIIIIAKKFKK